MPQSDDIKDIPYEELLSIRWIPKVPHGYSVRGFQCKYIFTPIFGNDSSREETYSGNKAFSNHLITQSKFLNTRKQPNLYFKCEKGEVPFH